MNSSPCSIDGRRPQLHQRRRGRGARLPAEHDTSLRLGSHSAPCTPAPQVADRSFTSGEAAAAQEYLLKMPDRVRKLAERANARKGKATPAAVQFSWVFNRQLSV